jgi:hypothetical protein
MAGNRSLADLRRALTPKGTLVLVGGWGGRWFMGTGRSEAPEAISYVGEKSTQGKLSSPCEARAAG